MIISALRFFDTLEACLDELATTANSPKNIDFLT